LIRSGIAGTSIVSAYITIVAIELRIATTFHAETVIAFPEDGVEEFNANYHCNCLLEKPSDKLTPLKIEPSIESCFTNSVQILNAISVTRIMF